MNMAKTLSEVLSEIAKRAASFNETVLAYLCEMAAMEAQGMEAKGKAVPAPHVEGNAVGIWDWDVSSDRNHLDPGCAELFGVNAKTAQAGMPIDAYLRAVHPDDIQLVRNAILATVKDGGVFEAQYRVISSGRIRRVFAKGFCTLDSSRRAERFPGAIIELPDLMN
jgi:PAS domain-containing protein